MTKWANSVEEFEIKNLETVQGDERDVIIISTVYGKDIKAKKFFNDLDLLILITDTEDLTFYLLELVKE